MTTPITYKASDIIADALQKLGVYAPGEAVTDADMSRCLTVLNDMLDQWQNETVFVYSLVTATLNLTNDAASYTIGVPGTVANITTGRPSRIQMGPGAASIADGTNTYPVNVVSALEWNAIQSINPGTGVPDTLFYDAQYPVGVLNVAPMPNKPGLIMTFYSLKPLFLFPAYATAVALSQGTADTIKDNLAMFAKPYFATAQVDPIVQERATISKEFLRTTGAVSRATIKRSPSPVGKPTGDNVPKPQAG